MRDNSHLGLFERLDRSGELDWSCTAIDSTLVGAKGGRATGPNRVDRERLGTKRYCVMDRKGTPLGVTISEANHRDRKSMAPALDAVLPVRSERSGRPRQRLAELHAKWDTIAAGVAPSAGPARSHPALPGATSRFPSASAATTRSWNALLPARPVP